VGRPYRLRFFKHKVLSYFEARQRHRHGEPEQQPQHPENTGLDGQVL
jgi:hypothetical protein